MYFIETVLTYEKFYDIADYLNDCNHGAFTPREIATYAYDLKVAHHESMKNQKPTHDMIELCKNLVENLESDKLDKYNNDADWSYLIMEEMNEVLVKALEEI